MRDRMATVQLPRVISRRTTTRPNSRWLVVNRAFAKIQARSHRHQAATVPSWGMAEGTIKRLTDKGFGFISNDSGKDLFFHMSAVEGVRFEDLREGQKVSYNEGMGPKGPRAENVRPI